MTTPAPIVCACGKNAAKGRKKCNRCSKSPEAWAASHERRRQRRQAERLDLVEAYGGKCVECDIDDPDVLVLDHINDDGAEHRKRVGNQNVYTDLIKRGYPDEVQLLCANCNLRKERRRHGL